MKSKLGLLLTILLIPAVFVAVFISCTKTPKIKTQLEFKTLIEGYIYTFEISISNSDIIYLSAINDEYKLHKSTDGGQSWKIVDTTLSITRMAISDKNPDVVFASAGG
jgi:hypothetical protein